MPHEKFIAELKRHLNGFMDINKSLIYTMIQNSKNLKNPVKKKMKILQKKSGLNGYQKLKKLLHM